MKCSCGHEFNPEIKYRHKVMCGDSTIAENVQKLMGNKKAALCLTDPPYGIGEAYLSYDDNEKDLIELINKFLPIAKERSSVVLLTSGVKNKRFYPVPDWVLCWFVAAGTGVGPWGFNCWQPILAYGKDPYLAKGMGSRPDAMTMTESADNKLGHPCSKPVGVWSWIMERGSTAKGDSIYDPFLGSGTTLVAAEQLGRVCFGMEISEAYVAICLERLSGIGLSIELIEDK